MSIVTFPTAAPASLPADRSDVDFERRWTEWRARGFAHDRIVRRRLRVLVIVTAVIAVGAVVAYGLLSL
jgi:hypothetical protein